MRFFISWLVPNWILFEIIPTKLLHYTLPMYPALVILIGYTFKDKLKKDVFKSTYAKIGCLISLFVGLAISILLLFGNYLFGNNISSNIIFFSSIIFLMSIFVSYVFLINKIYLAFFSNLLLGFVSCICIIIALNIGMEKLWVSHRVANILKSYSHIDGIAIAGYHEPSLVFNIGTNINLVSVDNLVNLITLKKINTIVVEDKSLERFYEIIRSQEITMEKIGRVEGFNAAKGVNVGLSIYIVNSIL